MSLCRITNIMSTNINCIESGAYITNEAEFHPISGQKEGVKSHFSSIFTPGYGIDPSKTESHNIMSTRR